LCTGTSCFSAPYDTFFTSGLIVMVIEMQSTKAVSGAALSSTATVVPSVYRALRD
jgi:hypothetical protein